jgi:hypothetical protein
MILRGKNLVNSVKLDITGIGDRILRGKKETDKSLNSVKLDITGIGDVILGHKKQTDKSLNRVRAFPSCCRGLRFGPIPNAK